jgi:hypothetical protein
MGMSFLTQPFIFLGLAATEAFVIAKIIGWRRTLESEGGVKW